MKFTNPTLSPALQLNIQLAAPSLRKRMACFVYEGILLFGVIFVAGFIFSLFSELLSSNTHKTGLQLFILLTLCVYFVYFWTKGYTLAMKTWKIKIIDLDNKAISLSQGVLRYFYSWVWFAPPLIIGKIITWRQDSAQAMDQYDMFLLGLAVFFWVIFWALCSRLHPKQQFWHDAWAKTQLVNFE